MTTYFEKEGRILVPTDFSDTCANALDHAKGLASVSKHEITLLHVIKPFDTEAVLREEARLAEARMAGLLNSKQIEAKIVVKIGEIFTAIRDAADELDASLIVLGTHGKTGIQKLVGSYALKVIDSTKRPVLVVQSGSAKSGYKSVVFPIGVTEEERQKAEHAAAFAITYGAKIHIFPELASFDSSKKKMDTAMAQITKYFDKHGVEYEVADTSKYSGSFDKKVASYGKEVGANLIFIVSDPEMHVFIGGGKEENFLFNKEGIPIMVVTNKKFKSGKFSMFS
jgi:nucleotide-binding universal stress UspA family protein